MSKTVWAAGAVVVRGDGDHREVVVVHRPQYDDWTLPKGKRKRHESLHVCAVREVAEETGLAIRLGAPLDRVSYLLPRGDTKSVAWWVGTVQSDAGHNAGREVDEVVWLPIHDALTRLTHDMEKDLLRQALTLPRTTPVVILRHGKAITRRHWGRKKADWLRPLARKGQRQAERLATALDPWGVVAVTTSSSTRCEQTVRPYADRHGLTPVGYSTLSEETGEPHPARAAATTRALVKAAVHADESLVICGHRPVLPTMMKALGVVPHALDTGAALVVHVDGEGSTVAWEHVPAPSTK